jgi:pimeloyl-ACP methyl ester carboxylesterase
MFNRAPRDQVEVVTRKHSRLREERVPALWVRRELMMMLRRLAAERTTARSTDTRTAPVFLTGGPPMRLARTSSQLLSALLLCSTPALAAPAFQQNQISAAVVQPNLAGTNLSVLRKPPENPKAHTGIFIMHSYSPYANYAGCIELARRGYTTLCADTAYVNRSHDYRGYEDHAPAIAAGITYLRQQPGITKVVILGHSMGAPMMAFYANVQQNGVAACTAKERIIPCDTKNLVDANGQSKLPAVDGVVLLDAHLGDALATFTYMDPAIGNEEEPGLRDPSLDMFAQANGYPGDKAAVAPQYAGAKYSEAFRQKFLAGQGARNALVLKQAQALLAREKSGDKRLYPDGAMISVPGSEGAARLWQADLNLLKCTRQPHIFLTRDGRQDVSPGPICSVRIPSASFEDANSVGSVIQEPVATWLGAHALRTNGPYRMTVNDISGIDYDSSNTSTVTNVKGITRPFLLVAHGAHYFLVPDEIIFDNAKSPDKTFAIVEGAVHGGGECFACEQAQGLARGYYGDTAARLYDYVDGWIAKRF